MTALPLNSQLPPTAPALSPLTVAATVTAAMGDGRYALRVGNAQITVTSDLALVPEQQVNLQITGNGQTLTITPPAADSASAAAAGTVPADGLHANFSVTVAAADFVRLAAAAPAVIARAELSFHGGQVTLQFANGEQLTAAENLETAPETADPAAAAGAELMPDSDAVHETQPGGTPASPRKTLFDFAQTWFRRPPAEPAAAGNFILQDVQAGASLTAASGTAAPATLTIPADVWAALAPNIEWTADGKPLLPPLTVLSANGSELAAAANGHTLHGVLPAPVQADAPRTTPPVSASLTAVLDKNVTIRGGLTIASASSQAAALPAIDKFIMLAGLTPGDAARAAASALLSEGLAVDRQGIQTLLALAAGRSGEERTAFLAAGARLLRLDAPIVPALAAGSAAAHGLPGGFSAKIVNAEAHLQEAMTALQPFSSDNNGAPGAADFSAATGAKNAPALPAADLAAVHSFLTDARQALDNLAVIIDRSDLPEKLRSFCASYARETLSQAAQAVENAAAQILQANPDLQKLDAAITAVLARLNHEDAASAPPPPASQHSAAAGSAAANAAPDTADSRRELPGEILRRNPKALTAALAELAPAEADAAGGNEMAAPHERPAASHPGLREFPAAWRNIDGETPAAADLPRLENALRQILTADTPEETASRTQEAIRTLDTRTLRELAANLQSLERDEIAAQPGLPRLSEAAAEIRDLGRMAAAIKAENLANMQNDPALCSASVPFKMGGESGDGKLQMFYRKSGRGGQKSWTQRVVLDLDFSALGSVIGDLRFLADKKLSLVIGSPQADTVALLQADSRELAAGLAAVGFPCTPEFRLTPPPAVPPPAAAPNPADTSAPRRHEGLIDVQA